MADRGQKSNKEKKKPKKEPVAKSPAGSGLGIAPSKKA
jgi:hypothetical protein